jgi:hypothetical protein
MDALSLGVTIRSMDLILQLEGEDVYRYLLDGTEPQQRRREVFTNLPDYVGDGTFSFPEGWHEDDIEAFFAFHRSTAGSLRWMVDHHMTPEQAVKTHARSNDYPKLIDDRRAAHRAHLGVHVVDREVLAHEERVSLVNGYVLPAIKRLGLPPGDQVSIAGRLRERLHGPNNRRAFRRAFRAAAPALEMTVQIFARQSRDVSRMTEKQDFWDVEHAVSAVYADAFVSNDSYLAEVLRLGDRRPPTALAVIISSIDELTRWLKGQR